LTGGGIAVGDEGGGYVMKEIDRGDINADMERLLIRIALGVSR
jgi:hypothetical protein